MSKHTKILFNVLDVFMIFMLTFGTPMSAMADPSPTGATITTQLPDYPPGAMVLMAGAGWAADEGVHVVVNADDGSWTLESAPDPVADSAGGFTYEFQLPSWFVPSYTVSATGFTSGTATVTFTDLAIGTYDQCSNDLGNGYTSGNTGCRWINGNLQSNNSLYSEGDATVQRLWLTDLVPGSTHTVTFKYGTTKGGKHAYDFLTRWDWSENWITVADRCEGITGCESATDTALPIPVDPNAAGFDAAADGIQPRQFTMRGGTMTNATTPVIFSGDYTGDSETVITVTYTVGPSTGSMCATKQGVTTCDVAIWFGAHVAMTAQWMAYNGTSGAATISGSPYHVALDTVDGAAVGQRDNQMQAGAVPLNGTIKIIKDAVPDDPQDFNFNLTNGSTLNLNFSLDDDADPTLLNSSSFSLPAGTYTAAELGSYLGWTFTGLTCTVTGSNGSTYSVNGQTATINIKTSFTTSDTVTCTYTNTKGLALTASKTANGSYNRTVTWTLTKSVAPASHTGYAGDSFNSTWTIVADKTSVPGNFKVEGSITINNPNNYAVPVTVTDTLSDGTVAAVSCPATSVPALGSLVCTYTASPTSNSATSNTATITSGDSNVSGTSATQSITWTEGLPSGYDSGSLADPYLGISETINIDTTKNVDETFTCPTDASKYVNGKYSYEVPNTATLDSGIGLSASAKVTVDCTLKALEPSKTAAGTYDRTVTWTITKSASPTSLSGVAGGSAGSTTWTIVADKTDSGLKNFVVTGEIKVHNPSAIAQTFTVSDVLNDAAGTVAAVTCPSYEVPTGGDVTCTYLASPKDATATKNTATISMTGNPDQVAYADITWTENLTGYDNGLLEDTRLGISETISGDTTKNVPEAFTCPSDATLYKDGKYSYVEPNTATLDSGIGLSASASVTVNCTLPALQVTKTAQGEWDRTVTWTLAKSVDPASHEGYAGDSFESTWIVLLTKIYTGPQNYKITGEISVYNPAAIAQSFTVADTLDEGTLVTVSCPSNTVAAGKTVTCTYTAAPDDASAKLNTAVVSAAGNADVTTTADVPWKENLTGSDSGNLTDPRFKYDQIKSATSSVDFKETFSCSTDPKDYTNGSYTTSFTNDAYFKNVNTDLHADASVGLTCHLKALEPSKTAFGEWDRTVTWTLSKSVVPVFHIGFAGDSFDSTWTVKLTKNDTGPQNYKITGEIKVHNPSAIAQTFTVVDTLDDGTPVTVTCPSDSVPAGGDVTCTYVASPKDATATKNTATISMTGNPDKVTYAEVSWKENLTGSDSGDLFDPRFNYFENVSATTSLDFKETFSCSTDPSRYTNGSYTEFLDNDAYFWNIDHYLYANADVTVECMLPSLTAWKDAKATYQQDITWDLLKTVNDNSHSGSAGQVAGTSTWTVTATKTIGAPYGWLVEGNIYIHNPANIAQTFSVSDVLDDNTVASVTCPSYTVPAGDDVTCTYTASPSAGNATQNTATIKAEGNPDITAEATVNYGSIHVGSETAVLEDGLIGYTETINQTTVETWDQTFECSGSQSSYTDGKYGYDVTNTAILKFGTETLTKNVTVGVDCTLPKLTATKDATAIYKQDIKWDLTKTVSDDSHTGSAGQDAGTSTWTVTATKTIGLPYGWLVAGKIYIHNPATIDQTFSISDVLDDMTAADVTCPSYTVLAGNDVECTYTASPLAGNATKNTATITAEGNPAFTAEATVSYGSIHVGSETAILEDGLYNYKETIEKTTVLTWEQTFACSDSQGSYTDGKYNYDVTNTATLKFGIETLTKEATVGVDCTLPKLVPTKTAQGEWDRTVTWTLTKTVNPASHTGYFGETAGSSTWTVVADKTVDGPKNFKITGEISIYNPSAITQSFTVADTLDDGTPVTLNNCPTSVVAGATVKCTYSAAPTDASAKLNTVTVSATGNVDQSSTAAVPWKENLTGYDSGTLADPHFSFSETISGDSTKTFPETFTCSADASKYTNGTYSYEVPNTATLNSGIGLSASAKVTVTCYQKPQLIIQKNAKPQKGTFTFAVTGNGYQGFTLSGDPAVGNVNTQTLMPGTYTVKESTQLGWFLTGIGGGTAVPGSDDNKYYCTNYPSGTDALNAIGDLPTQKATITLDWGQIIKCVFENTGQGVTRTQGFWATHTKLAQPAWFGGTSTTYPSYTFPGVANTPGIKDNLICGRPVDTLGKLMGGFWSDISKKSTGAKRTSLDQARMQLLQQLLAAELNASAFGSVPVGGMSKFAAWETALCGTNTKAIQTAMKEAATFNTGGDSQLFTPGTSADSKYARSVANSAFWDVIKP
jgi:hypothetical protein